VNLSGHSLRVPLRRLAQSIAFASLLGASACSNLQQDLSSGNLAALSKALDSGRDVNQLDREGRSLLAGAALRGQFPVVRELLRRGAAIEHKDAAGLTPLYLAAEADHLAVVQELVAARANVDSLNGEAAATPLLPAAQRGYRQVVEVLLERNANPLAQTRQRRTAPALLAQRNPQDPQSDAPRTLQILLAAARQRAGAAFPEFVNAADEEGFTALNRAAASNNPGFLQQLLQAGANPELAARLAEGGAVVPHWSPLHAAARHCERSEPALKLLLGGGAHPFARAGNGQNALLLLAACERDTVLPARTLIEQARLKSPEELGRYLNDYGPAGDTALLLAVTRKQGGLARLLLQAGASPDLAGRSGHQETALHIATAAGTADIVAQLLLSGARPDLPRRDGAVALHLAIDTGNVEIARLLLNARANPNLLRNGRTLLLQVTEKGQGELLKALLAAGAKPDIADTAGRTPLHVAAEKGDVAAVAALIAASANVNLLQGEGRTPLALAAANQHLSAVSALLAARAKPDLAGPDGLTPLYRAVEKGQAALVALLLDAGANPNLAYRGTPPLYVAVQKNELSIMRLLLAAKADPNQALPGIRWTPLHKAAQEGFLEAYQILVAAGADSTRRNAEGRTPGELARERQERLAGEQAKEQQKRNRAALEESGFSAEALR
jgi:cytohesin